MTAGHSGTLNTSVIGLAKSTETPIPLVVDGNNPFDPNHPATSDATGRVDVSVPAGTPLARFATFGADYPAGTDVDVFVYKNNGTTASLVGLSAGSSAEESVTLADPSGNYVVFVNAFASPSGTVTTKPNVFVVPDSAAGNLTATPTSQAVTTGQAATVTLNWSNLAGGHYLGIVSYNDGTNTIGSTIVDVTV
jgi:hypothetical protein